MYKPSFAPQPVLEDLEACGKDRWPLITGSTANLECYRKGVWKQSTWTHRASHSFSRSKTERKHEFQRNEMLTRTNGSPTTSTSCPRSQLHSNPCAQHLNYTLYLIPMRLNTWLPSCPTHRWRNWGLEKFSKLAMISWPPASNWSNLDSDQKPPNPPHSRLLHETKEGEEEGD